MRGNTHVRFGGAGRGNGPTEKVDTAPRPDPYLERLNKDIKRRRDVVGVFPNPDALLRLASAVLVEQHDEWQAGGRRYLSEGSMTALTVPAKNTALPTTAILTASSSRTDPHGDEHELHHTAGRDHQDGPAHLKASRQSGWVRFEAPGSTSAQVIQAEIIAKLPCCQRARLLAPSGG